MKYLLCIILIALVAKGSTRAASYSHSCGNYQDTLIKETALIDLFRVDSTYTLTIVTYVCYSHTKSELNILRTADGYSAELRKSNTVFRKEQELYHQRVNLTVAQLDSLRNFEALLPMPSKGTDPCPATTYYTVTADGTTKSYKDEVCKMDGITRLERMVFGKQ